MDISKAELEVLQALWAVEPAYAAEIIARLNQQKPWHDKTVKTLLSRLVKKGAIDFCKDGRQYRYFSQLSESELQAKESTSLLSRLFHGRVSPLVAAFASKNQLSPKDIDELKRLIDDWEKDND